MKKRKPIGNKLRFDIFKRDGYKCVYCGATPPTVVLEVDHIMPVIKGGENTIENLITSCFECNRGKGKHELNAIPASLTDNLEFEKERIAQYDEYIKFYKQKINNNNELVGMIEDVYSASFPDWGFADHFKNSVLKFINELGFESVHNAMTYSCSKIHNDKQVLNYFCGVCWNKIREKNDN